MDHRFGEKLKDANVAVTFRDVILLPGWVEVEPSDIDIKSKVTVNHSLHAPFVASPMDTVTEADMAIALARLGGVGILHRNCSVQEQVEMATKVKRAESLVIRDVITLRPDQTIREAVDLMQKHQISGLPVVENGKLTGLITGRDVRFADADLKVIDVMTKKVITAKEGVTIDEAKEILHRNRIEKLPIVDDAMKLRGLITFKDIMLRGRFPNAARSDDGRLLCGAATSPFDLERAMQLDKHVDIIVIDVSHFHNANVFKATKKILESVKADVVVGNIGTSQAAEDIATKLDGVAGVRVGIGSGSICTTSEVTKAGSPTLFATTQVADKFKELDVHIPIIADGGIKSAGDIAVALAAGASAVMMGNLFARCKEAPGNLVAIGGRYYKQYRGMGSPSAMAKRFSMDRYSIPSKGVPEGVEGWVPYKGDLVTVVQEMVDGLRASMGYAGARNVPELWEKAQFAVMTSAGMEEAKPHDVLLPGAV
ncbi:MAG: IMP dehydrogenase [archaeon]